MIKTCDDCQSQFNIFEEGGVYKFFSVCGKCWETEIKRRETGGVFTKGLQP